MTKLSLATAIAEIMSVGPIVAIDEDLGIVITVNGAYLNAWGVGGDRPECFDCRAMPENLYVTTGAQMIDLAKEYLNDIIMGDDLYE